MLRETPLYLRLNPADDVVIACRELETGTNLIKEGVLVKERIPAGHKVATRAIAVNQPVRRYNQIIGFATQAIQPGFHVHVHNLEVRDFARDYAYGETYQPTEFVKDPATFQGIVRADGRVATRNYIGILSTVNCSATVSKYVAEAFKGDALEQFPNVDGVVALTHTRPAAAWTWAGRAWTCCAARSPATRARQLRRRAHHRARLRGQPDGRALLHAGPRRGAAAACDDDPGQGRHRQGGGRGHQAREGDAAASRTT
jgi:hypothetical protein